MNERFDDIIRRQLQELESNVPPDLFDRLRSRPDVPETFFDNQVKGLLQEAESPVAGDLYNRIAATADLEQLAFDTAIATRLADAESPVPADMWNRITNQQKRRRKPVFWWWMAASWVLLVGAGTVFLQKHHRENQSVADTEQHRVPTVRQPGNQSFRQPAHPAAPNPPAPVTASAATSVAVPQQPGTFSIDPRKTINDVQPTGPDGPAPSHPYSALTRRHRKTARSADALIPSGNTGAATTPAGSRIETPYGDQLTGQPDDGSETAQQAFSTTSSYLAAHPVLLRRLRLAARLQPAALLQAKAKRLLPVVPCPSADDEPASYWYAEAYTSGMLLNKKIMDQPNVKGTEEAFDSTYARQLSYNVGINLVKTLNEHFLLKAGLQYNRLNEVFRLSRIHERRIITTVSVRTIIIAPGDTVYVRDTSVTEQIGRLTYQQQNTYRQWDVPVILGYAFGGKQVHFNLNFGLIANIRSAYTGMILDTLGQVKEINQVNGGRLYRTNVGLSLYAGLSIVKPLGSRTSLLIEPHARLGISQVTGANAWFSQKNNLTGISIGIRYQLNGRQRIYE